jgi:hypothetical protein
LTLGFGLFVVLKNGKIGQIPSSSSPQMIKPLEQFICDRCGELIRSKQEGWIEWISKSNPRRAHDFKIVHHKMYSPLKTENGCYFHTKAEGRQDYHLHQFANDSVISNLLAFIDDGPLISPNFSGPYVSDLREWTELTKRLTLPFYEEARFHISEAIAEGFIDDGRNPDHIYSVPILEKIAKKYSEN